MALDEIYSLNTKEGHEYKIGFSLFNALHIPEIVEKDVVDVTIVVNDNKGINNAYTLLQISNIIKKYLSNNDVILYCYCDSKEIERNKQHMHLTPQEYRSLLFQRMFDKASNAGFINKPITFTDKNNDIHCIHLISQIDNSEQIETITNEILPLKK